MSEFENLKDDAEKFAQDQAGQNQGGYGQDQGGQDQGGYGQDQGGQDQGGYGQDQGGQDQGGQGNYGGSQDQGDQGQGGDQQSGFYAGKQDAGPASGHERGSHNGLVRVLAGPSAWCWHDRGHERSEDQRDHGDRRQRRRTGPPVRGAGRRGGRPGRV